MRKIDRIHSGTACAGPSDVMERAIEKAAARAAVVRARCRISDVSPSNQGDGRTSWSRYVRDPQCSSPALTAMPIPEVGRCRILLRG